MSVLATAKSYLARLWGGWGIFWTTCGVLLLMAVVGQKVTRERRKAASLRVLEEQARYKAAIAVTQTEIRQYASEARKAGEQASASEARATELDSKIEAAKARAATIRARLRGEG